MNNVKQQVKVEGRVNGVFHSFEAYVTSINESAGTCNAIFEDGKLRRGIPLVNVKPLNEGLWNDFKEGLSKTGQYIKDALTRAYANARGIWYVFKGKLLRTYSPVSVGCAIKQTDGVVYMPSERTIKEAQAYGVSIANDPIESFNSEVGQDYIDYINKFWLNVIQADRENVNESVSPQDIKLGVRLGMIEEEIKNSGIGLNESLSILRTKILNEVRLESDEFPNYDYKQLYEKLHRYVYLRTIGNEDYYGSGKNSAEVNKLIPFIWGAPGIGKTEIVRQLTVDFKKEFGKEIGFISITIPNKSRESFSMPVVQEEKYVDENGMEQIKKYAQEIPMSIIPMYYVTGDEETDRLANIRANGGDPERGIEGNGCIIFLDELSRMSPGVKDVLLTLLQSRELDGWRLGSKCCIIAAGNRPDDIASSGGQRVRFDRADAGRYMHFNFVPTYKDWRVWAINNNIDKKIIDFLDANPAYWYETQENPDDGEETLQHGTPRNWTNVNSELKDYKDYTARMQVARGVNPDATPDNVEVPTGEYASIINSISGKRAGKAFVEYMNTVSHFSNKDALAILNGKFETVEDMKKFVLPSGKKAHLYAKPSEAKSNNGVAITAVAQDNMINNFIYAIYSKTIGTGRAKSPIRDYIFTEGKKDGGILDRLKTKMNALTDDEIGNLKFSTSDKQHYETIITPNELKNILLFLKTCEDKSIAYTMYEFKLKPFLTGVHSYNQTFFNSLFRDEAELVTMISVQDIQKNVEGGLKKLKEYMLISEELTKSKSEYLPEVIESTIETIKDRIKENKPFSSYGVYDHIWDTCRELADSIAVGRNGVVEQTVQ